MPNSQTIVISTLTGTFIGAGWWLFFDGVITAPDAFPWVHIIPAFMIMFAMFAINTVSPNSIEESTGVKVWLFLWFTVAMTCIGIAIWITSVEYPPNYNWPGVTIILQTMFIFMAGVLFFIGRRNNSYVNF